MMNNAALVALQITGGLLLWVAVVLVVAWFDDELRQRKKKRGK